MTSDDEELQALKEALRKEMMASVAAALDAFEGRLALIWGRVEQLEDHIDSLQEFRLSHELVHEKGAHR